MERLVRGKFNTQIYEEACEWFIECRAGDLDAAGRAQFDYWMRKSPEHQSAYLEIAAIWNEGPALDSAKRWSLDTLIDQAAEEAGNVVSLERTTQSRGRQPRPSIRAPARIAATIRQYVCFAAAIVLLAAVIPSYFLVPSCPVYVTTLGEQRSFVLSDGSTVQLNSLSKVRIRYTEHERTVDLLQGQALFQVAKDTLRPFIVHSGNARMRAVGTQFDVYRKATGTVVTVVEGRVAVLDDFVKLTPLKSAPGAAVKITPWLVDSTGHPASPAASILLAAGEQITITAQVARRTLHPNVASATAWTQRQLVFDSASLADVAEEFNRYNERQLVVASTALASLHISGVFSSTDPASLIRFLRDRPGLRVTEVAAEIRVAQDP